MPSSGAERVLLDTSAYSHLRRGAAEVIAIVSSAEIVYLPATVLGELEAAFRMGRRYAANARALAELLSEPSVQVVETTPEVARRYGELFAALRAAGTPIPVNDVWIAAAALATGARLITFDTDFARVPGLPHDLMRA